MGVCNCCGVLLAASMHRTAWLATVLSAEVMCGAWSLLEHGLSRSNWAPVLKGHRSWCRQGLQMPAFCRHGSLRSVAVLLLNLQHHRSKYAQARPCMLCLLLSLAAFPLLLQGCICKQAPIWSSGQLCF